MISALLGKLITKPFYKANTGFFLLVFIIGFGILSGKETLDLHYAIMKTATGSWAALLAALGVFALYNFKCLSFALRQLGLPENSFLYNMQAVGTGRQLAALFAVYAALYLPLALYGAAMAGVGLHEGRILLPALVLLWQPVMCMAGAYACWHRLNTTWKKPPLSLPAIRIVKRTGYLFYLVRYSLHSRKGAFIFIKAISLALLQLLVTINRDEVSWENICFLILFIISCHALLPVYYVQFMENELAMLRSLPLGLPQRYAAFMLTYAIIFLPELLFLLWNERGVMSVSAICSLYALAVAQLCLYTSVQYIRGIKTERYMGMVYGLFFVSLLLLTSVNLWLLAAVDIAVAVGMYAAIYYRYEAEGKKTE